MTSSSSLARGTLADFGAERLLRLCEAAGLHGDAPAIVETFRRLSRPWGAWPIGERPRRVPTILSDDHAPFELAAAYSGDDVELQFYLEPQGDPPGLRNNTAAGLELLAELAATRGTSLARWQDIAALFLPAAPRGLFTLLFGVTWARGRPPRFKVYVNPGVRGPDASEPLMAEAMDRLGVGPAWSVARAARAAGQIMYLCLDLVDDPRARVKVYWRHPGATAEALEDLAAVAADHRPGAALRFYRTLARSDGPFTAKPPAISLSFLAGVERPASATLEFPLSNYVDDDAAAAARVRACLAAHGMSSAAYDRVIAALPLRPLERGNGIHAHVTLRHVGGAPRITTYFATEAYSVDRDHWIADASATSSGSWRRMVER
jgi:DMATS type aromatic prenyltransferase